MRGSYILFLLFALGCLGLIDKRYQLVFYKNARRALKVLGVCLVFFIVWDLAGVFLDIFFIGNTTLLLGIRIGEFPVEELFFLLLLNYTAVLASQYLKVQRKMS